MIALGAFDWRHALWQGEFYPEDLPDDWRLTYYANAFEALGLAAGDWLHASPEELSAWVEDTRRGFRIYAELPLHPEAGIEARLAALAPRLAAILAPEGCPPGLIGQTSRHAPVWALDAMPGLPQVVRSLAEAQEASRAPLVVLDGATLDLRAARQAMDALGPREGTLLVRAEPRVMLDALHTLQSLRELMGWH